MMLCSEYSGFAMRLITVVVPVAVYFLILGLLNSRRHPQLLTGRQDFALLIVALSPLFIMPAVMLIGTSFWTLLVLVAIVAGVIALMSPSSRMWVVYNLPRDQAHWAISHCLESAGLSHTVANNEFRFAGSDAVLRLSEFPLLRNVTIRLSGGDADLARKIESSLSARLSRSSAETSPMAVMLLLLATGMLIAPATLFMQQVPQIVRIITDLIH